MTFAYTLVFIATAVEAVLVLLLFLPLGLGFQMKYFSLLRTVQKKFKILLYILFSLVFLLFVDSVNTSMHSDHPNKPLTNIVFDPYSHCKIFYAQRNAYLTTIMLILGFILYRVPQMMMCSTSDMKEPSKIC